MTGIETRRATWDHEVGEARRRAGWAMRALLGMAVMHTCLALTTELALGLGRLESLRSAEQVGQLLEQALHLTTMVLFLRWLAKTVAVASLMRVSPPLRWTPSAACWGFFIPFVNIVRPYRVIRDLHDRLAPDGVPEPQPKPRTDGGGGYRQVQMEKAPPPGRLPHASIGMWWALYLLGGWAAQSVGGLVIMAAMGRTFFWLLPVLTHGAQIGAAVLAVLVVRSIDGRLAERYRRLHHATDEELTEWNVAL